MTAEVAILNKYAVALAADSAVTISAGNVDEKIFDTADKIFELCRSVPIGIMIYNGMEFAEIPMQTIICNFRRRGGNFARVQDATESFLAYLNEVGAEAPDSVKDAEIYYILQPLIRGINSLRRKRADQYFDNIPDQRTIDEIKLDIENIPSEIIAEYTSRFSAYEDATFYGEGSLCFDEVFDERLRAIVQVNLEFSADKQVDEMIKLCKLRLSKKVLSNNHTGLIISGFGVDEIFPKLYSFEIDGIVCNRVKYSRLQAIDIDREGQSAAVIPFAQREMVERFLYGMDERIQAALTKFCSNAVQTIRKSLLEKLQIENQTEADSLRAQAEAAEAVFLKGLKEKAFESIRSTSRAEIETMVEFMPKPELAKMAEALVNLTAIKRRVSKGFETVGGPIDVAVISRTEGFIWVKRKHYFDIGLNLRYADRVRGREHAERE